MNTLLIGGHYCPELVTGFQAKSKGCLDYAAHNLQDSIIRGFRQNDQPLHVLSAPYLGSFPLYNKSPWVPGYVSKDKLIESISYLNVSYIKRNLIKSKVYRRVVKWCADNPEGTIVFYNFSCLTLASKIAARFPKIKIVLLVTDLPKFMGVTKNWVSRINTLISPVLSPDVFDPVDGYIFLTEKMTESIPVTGKPWMLLEGIYNDNTSAEAVEKSPCKTLLYTGNLGRRYGIMDLVEAFHRIPGENYRLQICGSGDSLQSIQEYQKDDNRIQYLGVLDRTEVIKRQKAATVLVNPRHSCDEYTKYSFPSKTMEYMASGTPVLMSKLECLPEDYLNHLYLFEDESIDGMSQKMIEVCGKDSEELRQFGEAASQFILNHKSSKVQTDRIIRFISSI